MGFVKKCQEIYIEKDIKRKQKKKIFLEKGILQKAQKRYYSTQPPSDSDSDSEDCQINTKELVEISKNQAKYMVDYCLRKLQHNMYLLSIFVPGSSCLSSYHPTYYFYKKIKLERGHYILSLILPHDVPDDISEEILKFLYNPRLL